MGHNNTRLIAFLVLLSMTASLFSYPLKAKEKSLKLKTVVIDPGHGGRGGHAGRADRRRVLFRPELKAGEARLLTQEELSKITQRPHNMV